MLLEGLHIPLTTPFNADGRVALDKLDRNVARYSKTPAAGLIVLGPSGEPTLLSDDETRDVLRTAAEAAAPEKILIAGIARDSVRSVLALVDVAAELHYDAILVGGSALDPSLISEGLKDKKEEEIRSVLINRIEKRAHLRLPFFRVIADRSPLPIVLLSRPGRAMTAGDASELATHPNIIGIVDTHGRGEQAGWLTEQTASIQREVTVTSNFAAVTARMKLAAEAAPAPAFLSAASLTGSASAIAEPPALAPALRTRTKAVGFQILSGNSGSLLDALNAGATGIAPAFAACAPQACYEVYAAWKDGDVALAEEKQARIRDAAALAESLGPGGLKYACDLNGYAAGLPRLPHFPPDAAQRAALEALMHPLRN
ncbi:MAG TPA: dihydrodipicolinate synthase family protein [Acidobacteriaceae bacterium]|nr:dihydrodipicolinate synthase family protein [Acidobacteriaceae bacterium]